MVPIEKHSDKEIEAEYLLHHLSYSAEMINDWLPSFRASVDKSGAIPQLYISEK